MNLFFKEIVDFQLENAAVSLWNFAVGLKTKGSLSSLSNAKCMLLLGMKLFMSEYCLPQYIV